MKPLQAVALGLVIVILEARFEFLAGYDAYLDPLGWLLILSGVRGLPAELPHRGSIRTLALIATAVSVPLSVPQVLEGVADADPSLAWAVYLPQFAFLAVLFHALSGAASAAGERGPSGWLRVVFAASLVVMVAPIVVFGAGVTGFADPAELVRLALFAMAVWLLFSYGGRTWSGAPPVDESIGRPKES